MKQFFYLSVLCVSALSACTGAFKKAEGGIEYKIISNGSGPTVGYGNYIQLHIKQVYGGTKDTVLLDTREIMPRIQILDSVNTPLAYYKIISQMKKGDSLVIRLLTDTAFKERPQEMPEFMKKGKYLYTLVKMVNIFESQQEADSANKAEQILAKPRVYKKQLEEFEKDLATKKAQLDIDDKILQDYFAKNNINAVKSKWGSYVAIKQQGTGEKFNQNDIVSVNYTGRTLDSGRVFDSNVDPAFDHVQPLDVNIGELSGIIPGWLDALILLNNGAKATVYIPSPLAYGSNGSGDRIKPNEILVFDMDILGKTTEAEVLAKQEEMQRQMMELQKKAADSIQNATKK